MTSGRNTRLGEWGWRAATPTRRGQVGVGDSSQVILGVPGQDLLLVGDVLVAQDLVAVGIVLLTCR